MRSHIVHGATYGDPNRNLVHVPDFYEVSNLESRFEEMMEIFNARLRALEQEVVKLQPPHHQ